ncbi:hypothetical protein BDZ85DRAFT_253835 [Elsinoe ampelina]|uniref:Uncharacterized protein n=1 Tax=Elsinoe ampelina TaxID=302913 RepID=A0A6A6GN64_9PEZI|nr:hypothetical protein BDZ85DRAFT_253835 [Elsinoe ampelina]
MTSDTKSSPAPPPPPYFGHSPSSYKLLEALNDPYDLIYSSPNSSYLVHLTREPTTPHLTLHPSSLSGPTLASLTYNSATDGSLAIGHPSDTKPKHSEWSFPALTNDIPFTVNARSLRWIKTYQTERHVLRPSRRYIQYDLHDAPTASAGSEVQETGKKTAEPPKGPRLATLSLLAPAKNATTSQGTEVGQLDLHLPIDQTLQDGALLLIAAIVHRDRQVTKREPLGPTIDVKMVQRPHIYGTMLPGGTATGSVASTGGAAGGAGW